MVRAKFWHYILLGAFIFGITPFSLSKTPKLVTEDVDDEEEPTISSKPQDPATTSQLPQTQKNIQAPVPVQSQAANQPQIQTQSQTSTATQSIAAVATPAVIPQSTQTQNIQTAASQTSIQPQTSAAQSVTAAAPGPAILQPQQATPAMAKAPPAKAIPKKKPTPKPAKKPSAKPAPTKKVIAATAVKPSTHPEAAAKPAAPAKTPEIVQPIIVKPAPFIPKVEAPKPQVYIPTIEEKNIEADRAFIQWKVKDPFSGLSYELRQALLNPDAITFLVDKAQMPFDRVLAEAELTHIIDSITNNFIIVFGKNRNIDKKELHVLLREVIRPEHVFQVTKEKPTFLLDKLYNKFMRRLKEYITPVGTTLQEWALRFLTSESIFVALPIIEAVDVNGKSFNQLTPNEKTNELQPAINIVAQRFLSNFWPVREKFNVVVPDRIDEAIKYKIEKFLREKFISNLEVEFSPGSLF